MTHESIPEWAQKIIAVHQKVAGSAVSHAGRLQSDRYFVWQEDGLDQDSYSDNEHDCEAVSGSTDLYTKREFDLWARAITAQYTYAGIHWKRTGKTYEPDTGFWHYSWDWVVI